MIQTVDRPDLHAPVRTAPAGHDATVLQPIGRQATSTPRAAGRTTHDPTGTTATFRYVVGARLPITIAVCANTPALATGYAATRTVNILSRVPAVFPRGRMAPVRSVRDPDQESVTAIRILDRAPNPGRPTQPVYTVTATILLGVRVEAPDRAAAWRRAHDLLHAGIAGLHTRTLHAHMEALDIISVRRTGPKPTGRAPRRQPAHDPGRGGARRAGSLSSAAGPAATGTHRLVVGDSPSIVSRSVSD